MRLLLVTAILLSSCNAAFSQEAWVVVNQKGHATVVEPYLKALSTPEVGSFDEAAARREASRRFPDRPLLIRGEFETREAFQKRVDFAVAEDQNAAQNRNKAVQEMRRQHAARQQNSALAKLEVPKLANQRHGKLFVVFPTTAPRYDVDKKQFSALPIPEPRLGEASYGFADMHLDFKAEGFNCSVELAKKIRAVSDGGYLWAVVELKNAEIKITKTSETVQRGVMEMAGESLLKSAPEIGIRLLAEYFNPGSTRNVPLMPQDVNQTKTVPKITVRITGETPRNHSLYDARTKTYFVTFEK